MTQCECPLAGFCQSHQVEKPDGWHHLCQTRESYFAAWEAGRGPGQSGRKPKPISWDDAAYLTSLIREVMDMQPQFGVQCDCEQCVPNNHGELVWTAMMFLCSAALMATLAVFVLWGAR